MIPRLFVTDFDGTLLTDDKTISQTDLNTLETLQHEDVTTVIATGRSAFSFERAVGQIKSREPLKKLAVDYVIFSTGAGIMEPATGKQIFKQHIQAEKIVQITRCFDEMKLDYMVHQAIPDTQYFLYKSHGLENTDFKSRIALYPSCATPLQDDFLHVKGATEVLAIVPPGKMDNNLIGTIRSRLKDFSVIQATSPIDHSSTWIEVFHKNVSKSLTTSWLAAYLGAGAKQVVSVGNDYNDEDLLSWAGEGFVVENGPDCLKKAFKVVGSNNRDGVSEAANQSVILQRYLNLRRLN